MNYHPLTLASLSSEQANDVLNHLGTGPHEVGLALSPRGERPVFQSTARHESLRATTGRPSCNAPAQKLCIINLVAQHDESPHQQLTGHGHFGFRAIASQTALIEGFEIIFMMMKFGLLNFTVFGCQITDRLHARMKSRLHSILALSPPSAYANHNRESINSRRRRRFITSTVREGV